MSNASHVLGLVYAHQLQQGDRLVDARWPSFPLAHVVNPHQPPDAVGVVVFDVCDDITSEITGPLLVGSDVTVAVLRERS